MARIPGLWQREGGLWQTDNSCEGFQMKTIKFIVLATLLAVSVISARSANREIYPDPSQAKADIAAAL